MYKRKVWQFIWTNVMFVRFGIQTLQLIIFEWFSTEWNFTQLFSKPSVSTLLIYFRKEKQIWIHKMTSKPTGRIAQEMESKEGKKSRTIFDDVCISRRLKCVGGITALFKMWNIESPRFEEANIALQFSLAFFPFVWNS